MAAVKPDKQNGMVFHVQTCTECDYYDKDKDTCYKFNQKRQWCTDGRKTVYSKTRK